MNLIKALDTAKLIQKKSRNENIHKDQASKKNSFKISSMIKLGLFIPGLDILILKKQEKKFIKYCSSQNINLEYNDVFHIKFNILLSIFIIGSVFLMPFFSVFSIITLFISYALSISLGVITIEMLNGLKHKTQQVILETYNKNTSDTVLSSSDFNMLAKCLDKQYFSEWMVKNKFKITYYVLDKIIEDLQNKREIEKAGDIWEAAIKDKEIIKL